jgi:hypothetical protein
VDNKRVLLFSYDFKEKMQTLRKMQRRRDAPEHSWRDSHTTEKAGEN